MEYYKGISNFNVDKALQISPKKSNADKNSFSVWATMFYEIMNVHVLWSLLRTKKERGRVRVFLPFLIIRSHRKRDLRVLGRRDLVIWIRNSKWVYFGCSRLLLGGNKIKSSGSLEISFVLADCETKPVFCSRNWSWTYFKTWECLRMERGMDGEQRMISQIG